MAQTQLPRRVATIGGGNMAEAILRGLLEAGIGAERLLAAEPDPARRAHLEETLGIPTTSENARAAAFGELVVLAVKPALLETVAEDLPADVRGGLFLSILAGRPLRALRAALGSDVRVVRAMPNTPALVGAGISALASDPECAAADLALAEAVLSAVGQVVRVSEAELDAVTALSGSGPAYVYLFIEALADAGAREGLAPDIALRLARETVLGAARMVGETGETPERLRERVSSPGGTTVAGLEALEEGGFRELLRDAVGRAAARSRELAG